VAGDDLRAIKAETGRSSVFAVLRLAHILAMRVEKSRCCFGAPVLQTDDRTEAVQLCVSAYRWGKDHGPWTPRFTKNNRTPYI